MTALSQVSGLPVLGPFFTRRVVPAIYSSGSTARAWQTAAPHCAGAPAVMLHDAPRADLAPTCDAIRATGAAVWYGVGIDGWARDLRTGTRSRRQIAARAAELAARAKDQGAELIMWNGEAAWRVGSDPATDSRIEGALRDAIDAAAGTGIAQGFTSFDHLLWHRLRWREPLGPGSAVVIHSDQRYGALGPGEALASPGQLRARCERAAAQAAALVGRGDVRPDLTDGGAGHRPYLQLHGVSAVATVGYALEQPGVCLWALPTRSDAAGVEALRVLVAAARTGLWGVRALQEALGVAVDGAYGPATHAAAVAWAAR